MNPNEVVKIRSCPSLASFLITRSASAPSGTLSTKVVETASGEGLS